MAPTPPILPAHERFVHAGHLIELYPGEDGMVCVAAVNIPGCHSQGRDRAEALANIREAIEVSLPALAEQPRTARTVAPGAEPLLGIETRVLDLGYVQPLDYMGTDLDIVQAARVSYGPSTRPLHDDRGLLRYLMRHRHSTPVTGSRQ